MRKPTNLKGQCHKIFCFRFFSCESSSSKPLKITVGSFQIFSKIRGDIHMSRCTTGSNNTSGKFSTSTAAWQYRRQICRRCQRRQSQIMGTILNSRNLKVNLKKKIYYMLTLLPKGVLTKYSKLF
jgi:hypothetical protein